MTEKDPFCSTVNTNGRALPIPNVRQDRALTGSPNHRGTSQRRAASKPKKLEVSKGKKDVKTTIEKRTEIPNPPKIQVRYSTATHKESNYSNPPSKATISQAPVPVSCNSGVATPGRARTAPEATRLYDGTSGKVVVSRLYPLMLRYSRRHCSRAALYFITKGLKTFNLRRDRDITGGLKYCPEAQALNVLWFKRSKSWVSTRTITLSNSTSQALLLNL